MDRRKMRIKNSMMKETIKMNKGRGLIDKDKLFFLRSK